MVIGTNLLRYEATSAEVGTSNVVYNFRKFRFPYIGLLLLKLPSYTPPGTAVPVIAEFGNIQVPITTVGASAIESDTLNKSGIYLGFYENGQILILSNVQ